MENVWEERKTLISDNGQEGQGAVPSGGQSRSVAQAQANTMWEMSFLNKVKW